VSYRERTDAEIAEAVIRSEDALESAAIEFAAVERGPDRFVRSRRRIALAQAAVAYAATIRRIARKRR